MPRPRRAQGRPGTPVFPTDWNPSHAVVVNKTLRAECVIYPGTAGDIEPTLNPDFTYTGGTPSTALYTGGCRVQVADTQATQARFGEQQQHAAKYLVVIERDTDIPIGAVVKFTTAEDASLLGTRRLVVHAIDRGSELWERDLYCTDDMGKAT